MCGIAGIVWQDPARPGDEAAVRAMLAALAHRGPDGEGAEVLGPAALGHRRLSVIDVSEAGRQPLSNEDGTVWLTFNGEIYNYRELRAGLEGRGHTFRSQTDSEVLVHLYEERGPELVEDLVGMFAFAIWDVRRQRLLLARDRAGQKPLHYRVDADALRFASEPAALLADPTAPVAEPDAVAIHHYVHYGYVPSPLSAFAGARKLPPAHLLEWRPGHAPALRRYWRPTFRGKHDASSPGARRRLLTELEDLLTASVRARLVADVPLGAFLSGGIDSGLIVATMAHLLDDPVRTFTIGFEQKAYDERGGARLVADRFRTRHLERVVPVEATDLLTQLVRHYGEPFADSSAIPTWKLAELTRQHVTVALSGDAGDELFAGYLRHTANEAARYYGALPRLVRRGIHGLVEALPHRPRPHDPLRYAKRFLRSFEQDVAGRNAGWGMVIKPETAQALYHPDFAARVAGHDATDAYRRHFHAADTDDDDERALWADFALYLPDDILVKVDIATMAHGLEARAPLLDHRLIEWAMRLPFQLKSSRGRRKRLLRDLAAIRLPRELVHAPKRGFAVPLDDWFRGALAPLFRDLVLAPDARTRGVFSAPVVEDLLAQHQARAWDWQHELWAILMLELWYRELIPARAASA